jgi:hypothetical protein
VQEFVEKVVQDRFLDIDSPFEDTLAEVEALEQRCNELNDKAKDINEF